MKFSNPLIVVTNMEKAKQFYYDVLGLEVVVDFGANVTLKGGITLQIPGDNVLFVFMILISTLLKLEKI